MALLQDAFQRYGDGARRLDEFIRRWSEAFNVDTNLSRAIAFQESSFNPTPPRGSSGEIGPFQVMPSTANWLRGQTSSPQAVRTADLFTLEGNTIIGIYYLAQQIERFGDPWKAVAAYNAGPTRLAELISRYAEKYFDYLPSSTQRYVRSVQRLYNQLLVESADHVPESPQLPPDITGWANQMAARLNIPTWAFALALILVGIVLLIQVIR